MKVHERDGLKRGGASRRGSGAMASGAGLSANGWGVAGLPRRGGGAVGTRAGGCTRPRGRRALFGSLAENHGTVQAGSLPGPAVEIASGGDVGEGDPAVFTLTRDAGTRTTP